MIRHNSFQSHSSEYELDNHLLKQNVYFQKYFGHACVILRYLPNKKPAKSLIPRQFVDLVIFVEWIFEINYLMLLRWRYAHNNF